MRPKALIIKAAGTNCERETLEACKHAGFDAEIELIKRLRSPDGLDRYSFVIVPGGFSYGDYFGAGVIFANEINTSLAGWLRQMVDNSGIILGVCNGFQVLVRSGLLPDPAAGSGSVMLKPNSGGKFECRWVRLKVVAEKCIFLKGLGVFELPVNHGEGRFVPGNDDVIRRLYSNGQVALKYTDSSGNDALTYPENPNGSVDAIAGICDPSGRIFGLMPHPERFISIEQHPRRFVDKIKSAVGLKIFINAYDYVRQNL